MGKSPQLLRSAMAVPERISFVKLLQSGVFEQPVFLYSLSSPSIPSP